ncbi:MAG TPA: zinc dependent phospholipase C family protein [Chitinophagaceae bacterium]
MCIKRGLFLFATTILLPFNCFCWGFYAHQKISYYAVFLLPPEMMVFYKPHIQFLSEHSGDPDKRRYVLEEEGVRHFIDIDHYGPYPYDSLPRHWSDAVARYGEDTLNQHGIAPWWLVLMQYRLTEAFKEKDALRILKLSNDLAHYMADIHVPLHVSSNHNGQLTGQQGVHGFWESRIPELFVEHGWNFFTGKASYVPYPSQLIWQRVLESAQAADTVLLADRELTATFPGDQKFAHEERNGVIVRQYSSVFAKAYNKKLNGMVERRMRQSIHAIASLWLTAWVDAGQPDLHGLTGKEFGEKDVKEFEELNRAWKINSSKGGQRD